VPTWGDRASETGNLVNHAAGPQGREGLKRILRTIDDDLGPLSVQQHHLIGDRDLVAQHLTPHGTHRASAMPLPAPVSPSGRAAAVGRWKADVRPDLRGRRAWLESLTRWSKSNLPASCAEFS
jgi:hypothetical protein